MINRYLSLAKRGKNTWWRYVISIILILFFYQIIGIIPLVILGAALTNLKTYLHPTTGQFSEIVPFLFYLSLNFILISLLVCLYLAVRFLHQRQFITLITAQNRISWKRFFQGFGVYFILVLLLSSVSYILSPSGYQLTFRPIQFLIFLPIALVLTPIQASAEELFFRGYLMQSIGLKTRNSLIPMVSSSVLFMLPHLLNPEARVNLPIMALFYFSLGAFLAFITVRDNSLELAMGAHSANNLFIALILNYPNSALPSPSIFMGPEGDPTSSLIGFIVVASLFCLIIFKTPLSKQTSE